jgi:hypothetical protein
MDPVETPASPEPLAYAVSDPLADANPYWVQRLYLGLTGMALGQVLDMGQLALGMLLFLADRTKFAGLSLVFLLPQVNTISFAIFWFSAVYLFAAREPKGPVDEENVASVRKLVIYLGCGVVLLACYPYAMSPVRTMAWFGTVLPILHLAAKIAVLVYLFRLADRAHDSSIKKHVPVILMLVLLSSVLSMASSYRWTRAEDVSVMLSIAAEAYFLFAVLQLRKLFALSLPDTTGR